MQKRKRTFETRGPVDPERNYVVPRTAEIADLVERIKQGRYVVIFAPRQTGKTTFFRWALDALVASDDSYFPIQLNFETSNIRRDKRFERALMEVCSYEEGVPFNLDNEFISELATYGVLKAGTDGYCEIANPIYQHRIMQAFQPLFNGLEREYLPEDTDAGFLDYLTPDGNINMRSLLKNFRGFIARAGYRILEIPETPKEFVGQDLLFAYLDTFVRVVRGFMYLEVQTGRGRMDLIILHEREKYIVETKIWEGKSLYQAGKNQLAEYLKLEGVSEGYYVVFDHRKNPQAREEEEVIEGKAIVSYVIPVAEVLRLQQDRRMRQS